MSGRAAFVERLDDKVGAFIDHMRGSYGDWGGHRSAPSDSGIRLGATQRRSS